MNENKSPYSLAIAHAAYQSTEPGPCSCQDALVALGYTRDQRRALYDLWDSDRNLSQDNLEAWQRCADLQARTDDLVQCNPVYLLLDAIRDSLVGLEDRIHSILSSLAPYPLHHPDSITPAAVRDIRQHLTTFTVTDLPQYTYAIHHLQKDLQNAENTLHEFGPEQADDTDRDGPEAKRLGDYISPDWSPY